MDHDTNLALCFSAQIRLLPVIGLKRGPFVFETLPVFLKINVGRCFCSNPCLRSLFVPNDNKIQIYSNYTNTNHKMTHSLSSAGITSPALGLIDPVLELNSTKDALKKTEQS